MEEKEGQKVEGEVVPLEREREAVPLERERERDCSATRMRESASSTL